MEKYLNLTLNNLHDEHLCCIIRTKTIHPGVEAKRAWLSSRIKEGHVFRKLNAKATVFIEYAPLEKAWTPISGTNYYYIYCLWTLGDYRGKGYGKELMEYCINDAKKHGKSGICMLGSTKQKAWLTNQSFAKNYGFKKVDETNSGYELLALSFDGTIPKFIDNVKKEQIDNKNLTIYYDLQCPYIYQNIETINTYCLNNNIPLNIIKIDSLESAKMLPCVFNNYAVFYNGIFKTVNLLNIDNITKIIVNNS